MSPKPLYKQVLLSVCAQLLGRQITSLPPSYSILTCSAPFCLCLRLHQIHQHMSSLLLQLIMNYSRWSMACTCLVDCKGPQVLGISPVIGYIAHTCIWVCNFPCKLVQFMYNDTYHCYLCSGGSSTHQVLPLASSSLVPCVSSVASQSTVIFHFSLAHYWINSTNSTSTINKNRNGWQSEGVARDMHTNTSYRRV